MAVKFEPGMMSDWYVRVQNDGTELAQNTSMNAPVPSWAELEETTFVSHGSYDSVTGVWTIGDLDINDVAILELRLKAMTLGMQTFSASATADNMDPLASNPNDSDSIDVVTDCGKIFVKAGGTGSGDSVGDPVGSVAAAIPLITTDRRRVFIEASKLVGQQTISTTGTADNPIYYEGFSSFPGDRPRTSTMAYNAHYDDSQNPYAVISSTQPTGGSSGTCWNINAQYNVLVGLQAAWADRGFYLPGSGASNNVLYECRCHDTGGRNSNDGVGFRSITSAGSNTYWRCTAVNNTGDDFWTKNSSNNKFRKCASYGYADGLAGQNACDYGLVLEIDTGSVVEHCKMEIPLDDLRAATAPGTVTGPHSKHGFHNKVSGDTKFYHCTTLNTGSAFMVRQSGVVNSEFWDCSSVGGEFPIVVRDGANNCAFHRVTVTDPDRNAILVQDTAEGSTPDSTAGADILFEDCTILNVPTGDGYGSILYVDRNTSANVARNFTFRRLTVDQGSRRYISAESTMDIENCLFDDCDLHLNLITDLVNRGGSDTFDVRHRNSRVWVTASQNGSPDFVALDIDGSNVVNEV